MAIETPQFAGMMRRLIRAYARRVSAGDVADLETMIAMRDYFDEAVDAAIVEGRARNPYVPGGPGGIASAWSWANVADAVGAESKQAVQQVYARKARAGRTRKWATEWLWPVRRSGV